MGTLIEMKFGVGYIALDRLELVIQFSELESGCLVPTQVHFAN